MQYHKHRDPNDRRYRSKITDEEIIRWHVDYYQQGDSIAKIAKRFSTNRKYLSDRFRQLGLPISHFVEQRSYTPPE